MDKWEVEQLQIQLNALIEGYTSRGLCINELRQIIDKAIEYIEDYKHEYYYDLVDKKEVLDILRGEDDEKI